MFYEGDLQSGIATAVRDSKHVVCFVPDDDDDESYKWENDFLKDATLSPVLARNAVLLKMRSGSQEAQYLSELYPLPKTPTLVIIRNGQLKEYLSSGTSRDDFVKRVLAAFVIEGPVSASVPDQSNVTIATNTGFEDNMTTTLTNYNNSGSVNNMATDESPQSREVRELLEERRIRMEAQKKEQEAKNKAEREAKAAARKLELAAKTERDPQTSADIKYALIQKKRQQEARKERARILKKVEDDKIARRERESLRKEQAKVASMQHNVTDTVAANPQSVTVSPRKITGTATCAVQVRLFDGTTIRTRFSSEDTLREHIRKWVDSQREDPDVPYTFKLIQVPLPNRTLSISEEGEPLIQLGLCPSATLVLVPVKEYASAYEGGGAAGLVRKSLSTGYAVLSAGTGIVNSVLGSLFGNGGAMPGVTETAATSITETSHNDDNGTPDDQQLYNGNNLNFEPRRDNDTDKQD